MKKYNTSHNLQITKSNTMPKDNQVIVGLQEFVWVQMYRPNLAYRKSTDQLINLAWDIRAWMSYRSLDLSLDFSLL